MRPMTDRRLPENETDEQFIARVLRWMDDETFNNPTKRATAISKAKAARTNAAKGQR